MLAVRNGTSGLEYVACEADSYVAISHVWADGLGNPQANTMPRCQLVYLQEKVNWVCSHHESCASNDPSVAFWIDTLCVPLHDKQARRIAISKMKEVYHNAKLVIVLDSSLLYQALPPTYEETLLAISGALWNQRLWTFQEGQLASRLRFLFREGMFAPPRGGASASSLERWPKQAKEHSADTDNFETSSIDPFTKVVGGHVSFDETTLPFEFGTDTHDKVRNTCALKLTAAVARHMHRRDPQTWSPFLEGAGSSHINVTNDQVALLRRKMAKYVLHKPFARDAQRQMFETLPMNNETKDSEVRQFILVTRALCWRSTSHQVDETTCLAAMLNLDVVKLLDIPTEDRMRSVLLEVGQLPKSFVLFTGPRDEREGYHWVPKSFLLQREGNDIVAHHFIRSEDVLRASTGVEPEELITATEEGLLIESKGFLIHPGWRATTRAESSRLHLQTIGGRSWVVEFVQGAKLSPAMVDLNELQDRQLGLIVYEVINVANAAAGVLCSIDADCTDDLLKGRFETLCLFREPEKEVKKELSSRPDFNEAELKKEIGSSVEAVWLKEEQLWLLS